MGLQQPSWSWQDLAVTGSFVLVLGLVFLYYLWRMEPGLWLDQSQVLLLCLVITVFMLAAKLTIPSRTVAPYIFPYAALTIILGISLNPHIAVITCALTTLAVGFLTNGSLELMTYAFAGSIVGMLKVRRGERLASFA